MTSDLSKVSSLSSSSIENYESINQALTSIHQQDGGNKALQFLNIAVFFAPENIPSKMFLDLMSDDELEASIKLLREYSLVTASDKENAVNINKLVQNVVKVNLKEQKKQVFKQALELLSKEINADNVNHAINVWKFASGYPEHIKESVWLPSLVVSELLEQESYKVCDEFGWNAIKLLKEEVGENHIETLIFQRNMGALLEHEGKYMKALEILMPLLKKDEILGHNELQKIQVLVAKILTNLNRFSEAESMYKTIFGNKELFETEDETLLSAWLEYADLQSSQGKKQDAIKTLREIIEVRIKIFGIDDDNISETKSSMATIFKNQGKCKDAMALFSEIYEKRKILLGENHLKTLHARRDVARTLQVQGKFDEALAILEVVLNIFQQNFGKTHPQTLMIQANMAAIFLLKNKCSKALDLYNEIYKAQCDIQGPNVDATLVIQANIAGILFNQGKYCEAIMAIKEVFVGFKENFGPNHPHTVEIKNAMEKFEKSRGKTIFSLAREGDLNCINTLIQNGFDINVIDENAETPIHCAARFGHTNVVKLLLEKGAIYNSKNRDGKTPSQLSIEREIKNLFDSVSRFFQYVKESKKEKIEEVIGNTCINAKESGGYTPLHWAVHNGCDDIVSVLLEGGADVTQISNKGNSALHIAITKGYADIFEHLLNYGTRAQLVDLINGKTTVGGNTPMHVACTKGIYRIVRYLLKNGVIYNARNAEGKTPVDLSEKKYITDLLNFIKELFEDAERGNVDMIGKVRSLDLSDMLPVINAQNTEGKTFQQVAIDCGHKDIADNLFIKV